MIVQPTLEQARRVNSRRTYSGPGFGPRSFELLGTSLSIGLLNGGASAAAGLSPLSSVLSAGGWQQACQSHVGLSYGDTMLATGGGPALGITGTLAAGLIPKPVKVVITANGTQTTATYALYLDGGSTIAQSGTCAASVAIAGLSGLSVTFAAGSYTTSHSYVATAKAWGDPTGTDGQGYTFTGSAQPIITVGSNGYPGLLFDGVDDVGINTTLTPGTTCAVRLIAKTLAFTTTAAGAIVGPNSNGRNVTIYQAAPTQQQSYASAAGSTVTAIPGSALVRIRSLFSNQATDTMRYGSASGSAVSAGATRTGTGRRIASSGNTTDGWTGFLNCEVFGVFYAPADLTAPQDAAFDALAAQYYPAVVV